MVPASETRHFLNDYSTISNFKATSTLGLALAATLCVQSGRNDCTEG